MAKSVIKVPDRAGNCVNYIRNRRGQEMTPTTLKALKASIAHWKRLETGKQKPHEGIGWGDCALCDLFLAPVLFNSGNHCIGCPVMKKTHHSNCKDSPYRNAAIAYAEHWPCSPEFKAAAKKERVFLESLLPKKRGKR